MEYKFEFKPAAMKNGVKYRIIQITDIALHTTKKTSTPSVGKKVQEAFEKNKQDRIYSQIDKTSVSDKGGFTLELLKMDLDFVRMVQEEEAKGYKVLIALQNEGIPVFPGKDMVDFMKSKNGRRILRKLAKNDGSSKI